MYVSYDPDLGATYVEWAEGVVASTVSVSDLVLVDVDEYGTPLGVDFAVAPDRISDTMLARLVQAFPALKELGEREHWLLTSA